MTRSWGSSTWPDIAGATGDGAAGAASLVVLVPFGSCEQHGPHLPLDTDTRIAVAVAEGAAVALSARPGEADRTGRAGEADRTDRTGRAGDADGEADGAAGGDDAGDDADAASEASVSATAAVIGGLTVRVAPAVAYGASGEHQSFAGTISLGHDALGSLALELGRSLGDQCRLMVFVNGHGGNVGTLRSVAERLAFEGRPTLVWSPRIDGADSHAGRTETSLVLAIDPASVQLDRAEPGSTELLAALLPRMREGGVGAVSPNGVLGDPSGASAGEGRALLATLVEDLAAMITEALA